MFRKKLKQILFTFILFIMIVMPAMAQPLTLWEFYDTQGLALPSIEERSYDYAHVSLQDEYIGSLVQNIELLDYLLSRASSDEISYIQEENEDFIFGGAGGSSQLPQVTADFESSLVSKIEKTDITMNLVDSVDRDGTTLSGWYGFTIESASLANKENVIAYCAGSSCSQMLRGISFSDGISTSSDRMKIHRRGADVSITNHPNLVIITNILNGDQNLPGNFLMDGDLTVGGNIFLDEANITGVTTPISTATSSVANVEYVNNVAIQGSATSTELIAGISELATQLEMASSTYLGADNPLVLQSRYATSSIATSTSGHYAIITDSNGELDSSFIQNNDYTFLGDTNFSGTSTFSNAITIPEIPILDTDATSKGYVDDISNYTGASASTNIMASANNEANITSDAGPTKKKEIKIRINGTINTSFEIKTDGGTATGQIYINGSPIGTAHTTTSSTYGEFSDNLIDVNADDLVQIYLSSTGSFPTYIQNFKLKYDQVIIDSYLVILN